MQYWGFWPSSWDRPQSPLGRQLAGPRPPPLLPPSARKVNVSCFVKKPVLATATGWRAGGLGARVHVLSLYKNVGDLENWKRSYLKSFRLICLFVLLKILYFPFWSSCICIPFRFLKAQRFIGRRTWAQMFHVFRKGPKTSFLGGETHLKSDLPFHKTAFRSGSGKVFFLSGFLLTVAQIVTQKLD